MDEKEIQVRRRLRDDYPFFSEKIQKVRSEKGPLIPFKLYPSQLQLHTAAEKQLEDTGRVRLLVPKARRHGASSYVEGRAHWRVIHKEGYRAFILTHRDDTTRTIFRMLRTFYEESPPFVKPELRTSNAQELVFKNLHSSVGVGTAKGNELGRGDGIQYFHGSEVSFWANEEEHVAGLRQAVSNEEGTEVWFESTGNGPAGAFYRMCQAAIAGQGDFRLVFLPWMLAEKYNLAPPPGWDAPSAWRDYASAFNLSDTQLYWAYSKNNEMAIALDVSPDEVCWMFRREYPAVYNEVFFARETDSVVRLEWILEAEQRNFPIDKSVPLILGVDTSAGSTDATWMVSQRGGNVIGEIMATTMSKDEMEIADWIAEAITKHNVQYTFIDHSGGYGRGVIARLQQLGFQNVRGVAFHNSPTNKKEFLKKKDEIWWRIREAFQTKTVRIINHDHETMERFRQHLSIVSWDEDTGRKRVTDKKTLRKLHGVSPDAGDALALTYTMLSNFPINPEETIPIHNDIMINSFNQRSRPVYDPFSRR